MKISIPPLLLPPIVVILAFGFALLALYDARLHAQPPAPPGPAQVATGTITILVDGKPINTAGVINIKSGAGVVAAAVANPAIAGTDIVFSLNTVLAATIDQVHANLNFCHSTNGTGALMCDLPSRILAAYNQGLTLLVVTDQSCMPCTINVNNSGAALGPRALKDAGTGKIDVPLTGGEPRWVYFDGTVFRLM